MGVLIVLMDTSGEQVLFCNHLHPISAYLSAFWLPVVLKGNDIPSPFSQNIAGRCEHGHPV